MDKRSPSRSTLRRTLLRVLALVAILAIVLPMPINDDNGYWQLMSYNLLHFGYWPFLQSWDHSFPGPLLFHLPVMALFGSSDLAFRSADVVLELLFCWLLYRLWRQWLSDRTSWLAVLVYALYYTRSGPFVAGEKDVFATILVFAGTYLLFKLTRTKAGEVRLAENLPSLALAALLVGCAALIKPMYALFLAPIVLFTPALRNWKAITIVFLFCLAPYACSLLLMSLRPGGISAYWNATILFNRDVYVEIARPFPQFLRWLISPKNYAIPMIAGLVSMLSGYRFQFQQPPSRNIRVIYISFIALSLFTILVQRKFYSYQFVLLVVLLAPVAALGIEWLVDVASAVHIPRRAAGIAIISFLCILSLPYEVLIRQFRDRPHNERLTTTIESAYRAMVFSDPSDGPTVAYFSEPDRQHATLEVASFDPRLRFKLARPEMSRYPTLEALGYRQSSRRPDSITDYQRRWREEYVASLRNRKAEYLIISRARSAEYPNDPYADVLHHISGFDSVLQAQYRLDTVIGTNGIYRLIE